MGLLMRAGCLFVLLMACGGAIVGVGTLYPSPWVDDWERGLRDGTVNAAPAIAACLAASGVARFREGTYLINPAGSYAIQMSDGNQLYGAGPDKTVLQMQSGQTGTAILMATQTLVADLTVRGNDEAGTIGINIATGKHRVRVFRARCVDVVTGMQAGNGASTGIQVADSTFESNTYGFRTVTASTSIVIDRCRFVDNTSKGIEFQASPTDITIMNCYSTGAPVGLTSGSAIRMAAIGNNFTDGMSAPAANSRCTFLHNSDSGPLTPPSFAGTQANFNGRMYATAEPTSGTWYQGEAVWNSNPGTTGTTAIGWVCTTGGTAGVDAVFQPLYRGTGSRTYTTTWDPASLAAGESATINMTGLSGLATSMTAVAQHTENLPNGFVLFAQVVSSSAIDVTLANVGGMTTDVGSGTLVVRVFQ